MLSGFGAAIVVLSLFLSARGYYFLGLLAIVVWALAGSRSGRQAAGWLGGLWAGLVTGAVGAGITLVLALLVHLGRLALFGVGGQIQEIVAAGPVSGFFDMGAGTVNAEGVGTGLAYILFVGFAFLAMLSVGSFLATAAGAVFGMMADREKDSESDATPTGDRNDSEGSNK